MTVQLLRALHVLGIVLWLGTGLGHPVIADIRRTLALGPEHLAPLIARLRTTTRIVLPAAVVAVATGFALVFLRGGFSAVPPRIHVGLALALGVFVVGGGFTSRAMLILANSADREARERAALRIAIGLRIEDALRFSALLLMLVPIEVWLF